MKSTAAQYLRAISLICSLIGLGAPASAIDHPDAPDDVAAFLSRAQTHEAKIQKKTHSTQGYISAYAAYEHFLDEELNKAYQLLMERLDQDAQQKLRNAQRQWLKYRDAEFEFIALNWTAENFGTSSAISRGGYRTTMIKRRVTALLHYLKNYTPPG